MNEPIWRNETMMMLFEGFVFIVEAAVVLTVILFVVGETVEHFTP